MNQTEIFHPELFPGELAIEQPMGAFQSEFGDTELEEERRGSSARFRSGAVGSRPPSRVGPPRKTPSRPGVPHGKPSRPPRRPGRIGRLTPWPIYGQPYAGAGEPGTDASGLQGSEYVRWAQDCLNRVMSARLPVDGVAAPATRSVIRSFQQKENLPVTGIVGPDTVEALKRACSGAASSSPDSAQTSQDGAQSDQEWESFESEEEGLSDIFGRITSGIGSAYGRVADVLAGATGSRIIDLTDKADKSLRKAPRDPKNVYALVLHQMACCFKPKDPLKRFLSLNAHFAILADGRILQLHPVSALLWASNGFNARSVAVEFAGNFPNIKGKWWKGEKYGSNRPTAEQFEAGRYLVRYLIKTMGLTTVLAHRQSSNTRENDPGPEIWYHVGQWAVENLGLKDGGPRFKHPAEGKPIPDEWRNWGRAGITREVPELSETESPETETAEGLWEGEPEGPWSSELSFHAAMADARANGPGIYTVYKDGHRLYVGKSHDLRRRLQQHLWCLQHLAVDPSGYAVKLTPMRGATPAQLQKVESAVITKWGRQKQGGSLTNLKTRELEAEIWGEAWN